MTLDAKPETYDLTLDDYAFQPADGGQRGHISCWNGMSPQPGDYLILRNGAQSSRYQVICSDPCFGVDPPTMWMADLVFAPRPRMASRGSVALGGRDVVALGSPHAAGRARR